MIRILMFLALLLSIISCKQKNQFLIIGTYTNSGSEGIYVYEFSGADSSASFVSSIQTSNPSFIVPSADGNFLYAVNEDADSSGKGGGVSSFSFDKNNGELTFINKRSSEGNHPCHLALDATGQWLTAGNYSTGNWAIFPVSNNGAIDSVQQILQHHGKSLDSNQQKAPHVHQTVFSSNNKYLYVPDLGIDQVMIYRFDAAKGNAAPAWQPFALSKRGSGPRHIAFHPNNKFAYLIEEITGSINVFSYNSGDGALKTIQQIATTDKDFNGLAGSSEIQISADGKFLYAGNRIDANNIAIFSIDANNGTLHFIKTQSALGMAPRYFCIDPSGKFLLVANQQSDEIVIFSRDEKTGLLKDTGKRIGVKKPVCMQWVKK